MDTRTRPVKTICRIVIHLYSFALYLYPFSFRKAFAGEMLTVFTLHIGEARGKLGLLGIAGRELLDLPFSVWQVRHQHAHSLPTNVQRLQRIQLTVRVVAAVLGIFLLSILENVFSPAYNLYTLAVPFAVALLLSTVSLLLSVFWGRIGGILTFLGGVAMGCFMTLYIYIVGVEQLGLVMVVFIGLLWALPFLIFGLLFYQLNSCTRQSALT